jgi:hypothetical protein
MRLSFLSIAADPEAQASGVKPSTESVFEWFSAIEHEWLLVFDNADGDPDEVAQYFSPGNRGNVLLMSRNLSMRRNVPPEASAEVDKMEEEDAISLLLNAAFLDSSSDELRRASRTIVNELCCLPLAVDQAGASISAGLCSIHDYLRLYTQHHQELLAIRLPEGRQIMVAQCTEHGICRSRR